MKLLVPYIVYGIKFGHPTEPRIYPRKHRLSRYEDLHDKDETFVRPYSPYNRNLYTGNTASSYRDTPNGGPIHYQ